MFVLSDGEMCMNLIHLHLSSWTTDQKFYETFFFFFRLHFTLRIFKIGYLFNFFFFCILRWDYVKYAIYLFIYLFRLHFTLRLCKICYLFIYLFRLSFTLIDYVKYAIYFFFFRLHITLRLCKVCYLFIFFFFRLHFTLRLCLGSILVNCMSFRPLVLILQRFKIVYSFLNLPLFWVSAILNYPTFS